LFCAILIRVGIMKTFVSFQVAISLITYASASGLEGRAASGCRRLKTDADWPSVDVWKAELPGVAPLKATPGAASPDYRIRVKSVEEVQKAIKICQQTQHSRVCYCYRPRFLRTKYCSFGLTD